MIEEEVAKKTIREWLENCLKQKRVSTGWPHPQA